MGEAIIYLVPDQMTFQTEYELVRTPDLGGMMRAQVFSFTRLAWRVLQETGGFSRYHLNNTGLSILLRKIIELKKDHLKVYQKAADQNGFIQQVEQLITELKRYCVTIEDLTSEQERLEKIESKNASEEMLANKLHDFQLIYQEFEHMIFEKYVDSEDYLKLLTEKIKDSTYLQNAVIYIDGFHSFTPQELQVIEALMKVCKQVNIALSLDRVYEDHAPHELNLFQMPARTFQLINKIAAEQKVKKDPMINLNKPILARFKQSPALQHLETYYNSRPTDTYHEELDIDLVSTSNRRAEVEATARKMINLVRDKGYRWRDLVILTRNNNDYQDLVKTIFEDYSIPIFIDQKRSMLNHPLIELIRSSLDIIQTNWRYDAVFRCVKTDLLYPENKKVDELREQMDELENYCLAYGIKGDQWSKEKRWYYHRYKSIEKDLVGQTDEEKEKEKKLNRLKDMIVLPLRQFEHNMMRAINTQDMCEALYHFLIQLNIPKKLEAFRDHLEKQGKLAAAKEHDQAWNAVIELIDQMVELMGTEEISFDLFRKMTETGLESMKFSLVPPSMDQVLIGDIEHSRFLNVKCTFILGVNEGVLPAKPKEDSIISEGEREALRERGLELAPGSIQQLMDENFIIYSGLTSSSDYLWISYPLADEEGKTLVPSILINRIKEMFPSIKEQLIVNEPIEEDEQSQIHYISRPSSTLPYVASQLQAWKKGYPISTIWWDAYNWFIDQSNWREYSKRTLSSLFYKNEAKPLSKDMSQELYGTDIQASVSRMEKFQSCAFSQFMSHGLRLKERQIYQLEAPDIGELFHAALKLMADHLRENKKEWAHLTKEESLQLSIQIVEKLAPRIQREILLSSKRYDYIKYKLQQIVARATNILSEHAKVSGFTPIGLELGFGRKEELPPIQFTLKNGCTMELIGRIDRVDKAEGKNGILLRVVDYKSSQKALNLDEVYFGIALQMLTYLDVVLTHSKTWLGSEALPAGVLYFHVHNPMLNKSYVPFEEQIEQEILKEFKMKGLLLADSQAVQLMDNALDSGHSTIIPAGLKKDGSFYSNSSVASREDFGHLQKFVRSKITEIGEGITEGIVDINPYKLKGNTPCTFCSYKSICQFDESTEENDYRIIPSYKPDEILNFVRNLGVTKE